MRDAPVWIGAYFDRRDASQRSFLSFLRARPNSQRKPPAVAATMAAHAGGSPRPSRAWQFFEPSVVFSDGLGRVDVARSLAERWAMRRALRTHILSRCSA